MNAFEEYDIGSAVSCRAERCGHLVCVVVDPVAERLTHLIVVARDGTAGRLVPVELAEPGPTASSWTAPRRSSRAWSPRSRPTS